MKNGITINGVEYRAVQHLPEMTISDGCNYCDMLKYCKREKCPCMLFCKTGRWVNFKKVKKNADKDFHNH